MTYADPDEPEGGGSGGEPEADGEELSEPAARRPSISPVTLPNLNAFASLQRHIPALDLSAVTALHRDLSRSIAAANLPAIAAAQEAVRVNFARSIDFSALAAARSTMLSDLVRTAASTQFEWAKALSAAVDLGALERANQAIVSSGVLRTFDASNQAILAALRDHIDIGASAIRALQLDFPRIDLSELLEALGRWLPENLRDIDDLEGVAMVMLDEGLPLSWVPRTEIVEELLAAENAEARLHILRARQDEVLDDCDAALAGLGDEYAVQCRYAVRALRAGLAPPAQSHAANIVDSVVLRLLGKTGREEARARAREDLDELPLQLAAENLTLRPLFRAFTTWWPSSNVAPPSHFARHATAHAVGHAAVFGDTSALIAVMLATSMTVQFADGLADGTESSPS